MSLDNKTSVVLVLLTLATCISARDAAAQPAKAKAPASRVVPSAGAAKSAAEAPSATRAPADASDAAKKAAILDSQRWRRAIFELNEWFSVQPFYDKKQVEEIKANLSKRVAAMSSSEVQFMLDDMDAKFQILDSKPAQEARAWLGHYLSVISDRRREEVLKDMPNLATMTAAQLSQEIGKIQRKRGIIAAEQAASDRTRTSQVDSQLQANRAAQQAYIRQQKQAPTTYSSPYRVPSSSQRPFDDRPTGSNMEFYSGNFGQFGIIFNPSSY
jgi:hypothetical protein